MRHWDHWFKLLLHFMHRKSSQNRSVDAFCNRTILLWKVLDHPYDCMQLCFALFFEDFSECLFVISTNDLMGQNQKTLVKAFCYIMEHGSPSHHLLLGKLIIRQEPMLTAFLAAISAQLACLEFVVQGFLLIILNILNKCLVHNSITN